MTTTENKFLDFLLGSTRLDVEEGYYIFDIEDDGENIRVSVDYERTILNETLQPIGKHCVFNKTYPASEFSFERLSEELNDQNLNEVDRWLLDLFNEKGFQ